MYEKLMNSLTNHSFDMMRALMGQERQDNYMYLSIIVLLILILSFCFAACTKNITARTADLHRALELASNTSIQQMAEMSGIDFQRREQLLHDDNGGSVPVRAIGNAQ